MNHIIKEQLKSFLQDTINQGEVWIEDSTFDTFFERIEIIEKPRPLSKSFKSIYKLFSEFLYYIVNDSPDQFNYSKIADTIQGLIQSYPKDKLDIFINDKYSYELVIQSENDEPIKIVRSRNEIHESLESEVKPDIPKQFQFQELLELVDCFINLDEPKKAFEIVKEIQEIQKIKPDDSENIIESDKIESNKWKYKSQEFALNDFEISQLEYTKIKILYYCQSYLTSDELNNISGLDEYIEPIELIKKINDLPVEIQESPECILLLADLYFVSTNFLKSKEYYLNLEKFHEPIYQSEYYMGIGRYDLEVTEDKNQASNQFRKSIEINPNNSIALLNLSKLESSETKSNVLFLDAMQLIDFCPKNLVRLSISELYFIIDKKIEYLKDFESAYFYLDYLSYQKVAKNNLFPYKERIYELTETNYYKEKFKDSYIDSFKENKDEIFDLYIKKKEAERLKEREKTFQDLAHTVKNIVSSLTDLILELDQKVDTNPDLNRYKIYTKPAIKGITVLQNLFNTINQSFRIQKEDFFYDARTQTNAMSIKEILFQAFLYSLGNMFDSKYFGKFQKVYFPTLEQFKPVKVGWEKGFSSIDDMIVFVNKYFFQTSFRLDIPDEWKLSDSKESKLKLLLLFQEILLNMIKYSCFVPFLNRFISIHIQKMDTSIFFEFENSYNQQNEMKNTGIGLFIINNYKPICTSSPIFLAEDTFKLNFTLINFWETNE